MQSLTEHLLKPWMQKLNSTLNSFIFKYNSLKPTCTAINYEETTGYSYPSSIQQNHSLKLEISDK